jgi:hypothetical protein
MPLESIVSVGVSAWPQISVPYDPASLPACSPRFGFLRRLEESVMHRHALRATIPRIRKLAGTGRSW